MCSARGHEATNRILSVCRAAAADRAASCSVFATRFTLARPQRRAAARASLRALQRPAESIRHHGGTTALPATVTVIPGLVAVPVASVATLWSV